MAPTLRPYQLEAVEAIERAAAEGDFALVVLPTGTGKTVVFSELVRRRGGRALIVAHRDELLDQAGWKLVGAGMAKADIGLVKAERDEVTAPVVLASVQTLARKRRRERLLEAQEEHGYFRTVVVDEVHHVPAPSYRALLDDISEWAGSEHPLVVGVTATPGRKGVTERFGKPVYSRDLVDMIAEGWLCDLRGRRVTLDLDLRQVRKSAGDYVEAELAEALEEAGAPVAVAAAWAEHAEGRQTLVFTPGVALAHETAAALRDKGAKAEAVDGAMDREERRAVLHRYRKGETKVLVNCAVLTEGVDLPTTSCVVIARPTLSPLLYCFDAETEILTPNGWVPGALVVRGDQVAAFGPQSGSVQWEPVTATVRRKLLPGERMLALQSPTVDLRVTSTHRLLWRPRQGSPHHWGPWRFDEAADVALHPDNWQLPVAGLQDAPGIPLTDDEIAFIAWVQAEGCVNRATGGIAISQSFPEGCAHIEKVLSGCGFKWRVSEDYRPTNFGPRTWPLRIYRVSRGAPRGEDKHLRGWCELAPWLPKQHPSAWGRLDAMSHEQLAVFLDAWHRANGNKQAGQSWTRRGYHLAVRDKAVADWLQSICVRRGWRANVAPAGSIWTVHCRDLTTRTVGGATAKDRPALVESPARRGEQVWCVSVPSGAVIVRRNGKAAVVGNCQMIGRGTRLAPGKADCLVLDLVGATEAHDLSRLGTAEPASLGRLVGLKLSEGQSVLGAALADKRRRAALERLLAQHGRLVATDVDLFGRRSLHWLTLPGQSPTYLLSLGDQGHAAVVADEHGRWTLYQVSPEGGPVTIGERLRLDQATARAEELVLSRGAYRLANPHAAWRSRPVSPRQVAVLVSAHHVPRDAAATLTRGQAADLLDGLFAERRLRKAGLVA